MRLRWGPQQQLPPLPQVGGSIVKRCTIRAVEAGAVGIRTCALWRPALWLSVCQVPGSVPTLMRATASTRLPVARPPIPGEAVSTLLVPHPAVAGVIAVVASLVLLEHSPWAHRACAPQLPSYRSVIAHGQGPARSGAASARCGKPGVHACEAEVRNCARVSLGRTPRGGAHLLRASAGTLPRGRRQRASLRRGGEGALAAAYAAGAARRGGAVVCWGCGAARSLRAHAAGDAAIGQSPHGGGEGGPSARGRGRLRKPRRAPQQLLLRGASRAAVAASTGRGSPRGAACCRGHQLALCPRGCARRSSGLRSWHACAASRPTHASRRCCQCPHQHRRHIPLGSVEQRLRVPDGGGPGGRCSSQHGRVCTGTRTRSCPATRSHAWLRARKRRSGGLGRDGARKADRSLPRPKATGSGGAGRAAAAANATVSARATGHGPRRPRAGKRPHFREAATSVAGCAGCVTVGRHRVRPAASDRLEASTVQQAPVASARRPGIATIVLSVPRLLGAGGTRSPAPAQRAPAAATRHEGWGAL
jgi:hypothetical protein